MQQVAYLLYVLDLHAAFVNKCHPLLSKQVATVLVQDTLNLCISLNNQRLCLLQPFVTCIQHLLVFICTSMVWS